MSKKQTTLPNTDVCPNCGAALTDSICEYCGYVADEEKVKMTNCDKTFTPYLPKLLTISKTEDNDGMILSFTIPYISLEPIPLKVVFTDCFKNGCHTIKTLVYSFDSDLAKSKGKKDVETFFTREYHDGKWHIYDMDDKECECYDQTFPLTYKSVPAIFHRVSYDEFYLDDDDSFFTVFSAFLYALFGEEEYECIDKAEECYKYAISSLERKISEKPEREPSLAAAFIALFGVCGGIALTVVGAFMWSDGIHSLLIIGIVSVVISIVSLRSDSLWE